MAEEVIERLAFMRHAPQRALVVGDPSGTVAAELEKPGAQVISANPFSLDEERPYPMHGFDLIVSAGSLDTINDLPGALIQMRQALAPGGIMMALFPAAGSLPHLRHAMLATDGERPAGRMHPAVDARAGAGLMQRAGFARQVVDSITLQASYRSMDRLVADLRDMALGNVLTRPAPGGGKAWLDRARAAFAEKAGADGRTVETCELLVLTGWKT